MKYLDYKEKKQHGTFDFPIAYYHENPMTPRYHMTYHWHPDCELVYIKKGHFSMTLDDNTHTFKSGDVVFISGGMLHGGTPFDCTYDCIVFNLEMMLKNNTSTSKIISDINHKKIVINTLLSSSDNNITEIASKLCDSLSARSYGYELEVQGFLYILFGEIIKGGLFTDGETNSISLERLSSIKNVLTYISENYSDNISLDSLAKIAGMNPKYFCRFFKSVTDRTPIDYLNYYRVESACEILSTKDVTISEVAISCGFNDESYFIKTFKKYKDITPKQYLKRKF